MHDTYGCLAVKHRRAPLPDGFAAVALAAGHGRRLAPLTSMMPKPLLPVLNLPLLLWTTARLKWVGVTEVSANVHHLSDTFGPVRTICDHWGPRLRLVRERAPTGPLGGLLSCRSALKGSRACVVISGDALHDIDLSALAEAHLASGAPLTLSVTKVDNPQRYGVVNVDASGFVTGMREKPQDAHPSEYVSCGIYVISLDLLARLTQREGTLYDFVDLVKELLYASQPVFTFPVEDWMDVGTPADLLVANLAYLKSLHLSEVASHRTTVSGGELWSATRDLELHGVMVFNRALIATGAQFGNGVRLEDVVIGAHSHIGAGAELKRTVVLPGSRIPARAVIVNRVVAPNAI